VKAGQQARASSSLSITDSPLGRGLLRSNAWCFRIEALSRTESCARGSGGPAGHPDRTDKTFS